MRKLLFVVLLLAVGVVALGVYMDWFRFSKGGDQGSGKVDVGVTIDTEKIKTDAEKAKDKVRPWVRRPRNRPRAPSPRKRPPRSRKGESQERFSMPQTAFSALIPPS